MFAQHLSKIRIAVCVDAGTFFAQRAQAHHVVPTALGTDVEALDHEHAPSADRLQSRLRDFKSRAPSQRQTGRFEANDVIRIIACATGEFGEPLSGLIVYERLGPRAAGAAAALQEAAKLIARRQCPGDRKSTRLNSSHSQISY